jgi:hypothetical protein
MARQLPTENFFVERNINLVAVFMINILSSSWMYSKIADSNIPGQISSQVTGYPGYMSQIHTMPLQCLRQTEERTERERVHDVRAVSIVQRSRSTILSHVVFDWIP